MTFNTIVFDSEDGIAKIIFNRPKALNALNSELLAELDQALESVAEDESNRVLVLTGAGEKAFIAGADITELAKCDALSGKIFARQGQKVINKLEALSIPVIAAVNGYALGGGSEVALACDFIYAADSAMFGLPEITLGLIPGFGGTQRLPRSIAIGMARELIYTGKMISATEAQALGFVNRVVPLDKLMRETEDTARSIAMKGIVALRAAKEAVNNGLNVDLASGLARENDAFALCMASIDAKEGTQAFLDKRKPSFKGKIGG
jgi:enoyl-CoA hydratase